MELSAGTRLGPYEIVRAIGAGGMGVVYRAKDTRLDRSVAIKVLPEALREDAERLRRFEQEARTIGGLSHPNLVTLHDVGRESNVPYLVTELLEGQSLRGKLADGEVAIRDAIRIAAEIARGLAAAHGAGIIHRDIKPENVFVTSDGRVKILDFGIAKLRRDADGDVGNAATLGGGGTAATGAGVVIGTPGYMAPEQLAGGGDVDTRTDVFALGVVLYEMLSRKRPFAADTGLEESYAVVKTAAPPLPDSVPPALARIVMRCLEKRREARFQSASDLAFALEALDGTAQITARVEKVDAEPPPARRAIPIVPIAGAVALAAVAGAAGWFVHGRRHAAAAATTAAAEGMAWPALVAGGPAYHRITFHSEQKWFARFAPDHQSVLYSTRDGEHEEYRVVRSSLSRASVAPIAGATGRLLDVSASGELALRQRRSDEPGGLLVTYVEGTGAPRERAENAHDAAYVGEELAIVRDHGTGMGIEFPIGKSIVQVEGSELDLLRASRDGTRFAVAIHPIEADTRGNVVVYDRAGHEVVRSAMHDAINGLAWSPDDHEVWLSTDQGLEALDLHGHERMLLRNPHDLYLRDVLPDGRILVAPRDARVRAFVQRGTLADRDIGWRDGAVVVAMSRDGSTIAMLDGGGTDETAEGYQLFIRGTSDTPVAIDHGYQIALVPDGSRAVVLCSCEHDPLRLVPTTARAGVTKPIAFAPIEQLDLSARLGISGDGAHVIAMGAAHGGPMRLWSIALDGSGARPIGPEHLGLTSEEAQPHLHVAASPDDKWLALPAPRGVRLVAMTGSEERTLPGDHGESPLGFSSDGKAVFVIRTKGWPRAVTRVDLASGERSVVKAIDLLEHPERADFVIDGTASTIAYSWIAGSADLFVLEPPAH